MITKEEVEQYTQRIEESTKKLDISSKKLDKINDEKINHPILDWLGRFINGNKGH